MTFFPKLVRVALYIVIFQLLLILIFAAIRYPLMNSDNYVISPDNLKMSRAELCLWQSVMCQTNISIEVTPKTTPARIILALQSFVSYLATCGGIIFVFDWRDHENKEVTTFT